ncbi:MAG: hypothetical protein GW886_10725 [Rhodobacterales bacterium]|nr:hypothetical protein [Rhodobacterales bacterium]
MSGICGILRLDGAAPDGLAAMTAQLQARGPEGTRHFADGPCALGHTLLATTPEAQVEVLPLTEAATGCTITADLRLDNRDELLAALGMADTGRVIGDAEIVLRAYLRWGEGCLAHLLGDFAFAIWDRRRGCLFAARDPIGMKQLIHAHLPGRVFAFASSAQAVLAAPDVPRAVNEGRIADYLEDYLEGIDFTSTFYEGVFRLPPAHCLTVDAAGLRIRRYWALVPGPPLTLDSDEAYAAAFLEVFTEAVRCRLRAPAGALGSMLSGGMDSGSVVAVATRLLAAAGRGPLPTFSGVGPDPATCVETRAIHDAITMPGLAPHLVDWSKPETWADPVAEQFRAQEEPFDVDMNLVRAVYLQAQAAGVRVMLDGVAGDLVVNPGSYLVRLIRRGRLVTAYRCVKGEEAFWQSGGSVVRAFARELRSALIPDVLRVLRRRWSQWRPQSPQSPLIAPDFARAVNMSARLHIFEAQRLPQLGHYANERADSITHTYLAVGRERYDRVAAQSGIEPRDPFSDLRVIRFCLALPAEQLGGKGWPKYVLRMAVTDLLPDAVRWRKGKEHIGYMFNLRLAAGLSQEPDIRHLVKRFVNLSAVSGGQDAEAKLQASIDVAGLSHWLDAENERTKQVDDE